MEFTQANFNEKIDGRIQWSCSLVREKVNFQKKEAKQAYRT